MAWLLCLFTFPAVGQHGARQVVRQWARLLYSEDAEERVYAATKLITSPEPTAIEELRKALSSDQPDTVRINVIRAFKLERTNDKAVDLLIDALDDESDDVRLAAGDALKAIRTPYTLGLLRDKARDKEGPLHTRTQVIGILGEQRDLDSAPVLIQLLSAPLPEVRSAADAALEQITLRHFDSTDEWQQWWEEEGKKDRVRLLEDTVKRQADRIQSMNRTIERLYSQLLEYRKDRNDYAFLAEILKEGSFKVKLDAIQQLKTIKSEDETAQKEIRAALIGALTDPKPDVRAAAASALASRPAPDVAAALISSLNDAMPIVRTAAAQSLAKVRTPLAVKPLTRLLDDRHAGVAEAAARALGELGDAAAVPALVSVLDEVDEDSGTYVAAVEALSKISGPTVRPVLTDKLLRSKNHNVRWHAVMGLGAYAPEIAVPELSRVARNDGNAGVRIAALEALARTGSAEAIKPIVGGLSDREKEVRSQAFRALNTLADGKAAYFDRAMDLLIAQDDFSQAERVLRSAVDRLDLLPNHVEQQVALRYNLVRALLQAEKWDLAEPHLEKLYGADQKNPVYIRDLIACRRALEDRDGNLALLEHARANLPEDKVAWWRETLVEAESLLAAKEFDRVIALVDDLEKEDAGLGGPETAAGFEELREKARAQLAPAPMPASSTPPAAPAKPAG
jgi:HEAT repeat protein